MRQALALVAFLGCAMLAGPARAGALDFRLRDFGPATMPAGDWSPGAAENRAFRLFANQLGATLSSVSLEPPGTSGQNGIDVGFGYTVAHVDSRREIWPTTGDAGSTVHMPSIIARKGLPQSFELGARFTSLEQSQMRAGTVQLKWSPLEGIDYAPDAAVRVHVTRLFGARDFGMVTGGADLSVGKRFTLFEFVNVTPFGGYDLLVVNADSKVIDFATDAVPHDEDPTKYQKPYDLVWFTQNVSHRFYLGARISRSVLDISGELSWVRPPGLRTIFASSLKLGVAY